MEKRGFLPKIGLALHQVLSPSRKPTLLFSSFCIEHCLQGSPIHPRNKGPIPAIELPSHIVGCNISIFVLISAISSRARNFETRCRNTYPEQHPTHLWLWTKINATFPIIDSIVFISQAITREFSEHHFFKLGFLMAGCFTSSVRWSSLSLQSMASFTD